VLVAFSLLFKLALAGPLAHGGLALGQTLATLVSVAFLLWRLRAQLGTIGGRELAARVGVNLCTAAAGALAGWGLFRLLSAVAPGSGLLAQSVRLFPGLGVVVAVHVGLALLLGNREGAEVVERAVRRLRRRA